LRVAPSQLRPARFRIESTDLLHQLDLTRSPLFREEWFERPSAAN
jgi:hypothetical protein